MEIIDTEGLSIKHKQAQCYAQLGPNPYEGIKSEYKTVEFTCKIPQPLFKEVYNENQKGREEFYSWHKV